MAQLRVLILAAYPTTGYGLRVAVESDGDAGVVVASATEWSELPGLVGSAAPDAILADIEWTADDLDELGGPESLPPVLLLVDTSEHGLDALAAGFSGVLLRDAEPEEILAALRALAAGLTVIDRRVQPLLAGSPAGELSGEAGVPPLSQREIEVLELIARGYPNKAIAVELGISEHTVKFHVGSILSKLGAASRAEALARAISAGLVTV